VEIAGFHTQQLQKMLSKKMADLGNQGIDANNPDPESSTSQDPDKYLHDPDEDPDDDEDC